MCHLFNSMINPTITQLEATGLFFAQDYPESLDCPRVIQKFIVKKFSRSLMSNVELTVIANFIVLELRPTLMPSRSRLTGAKLINLYLSSRDFVNAICY